MALSFWESETLTQFTGQSLFNALAESPIPFTSHSTWGSAGGYLRYKQGKNIAVIKVIHVNTNYVRLAIGAGQLPSESSADDEAIWLTFGAPDGDMAYAVSAAKTKIFAAYDSDRLCIMLAPEKGEMSSSNDELAGFFIGNGVPGDGSTGDYLVCCEKIWAHNSQTPSTTLPPYYTEYKCSTASDVEYNTSKFAERLEERVYCKAPLLQLGDLSGFTNLVAPKSWQILMDDTGECMYAGYVTLNGKQYYRLGAFILEE